MGVEPAEARALLTAIGAAFERLEQGDDARTTIARADDPGDAVETAGIEPASAIAQKAASTSVAGALYLAFRSPHRRGCRLASPIQMVPPGGSDGRSGGDPAN